MKCFLCTLEEMQEVASGNGLTSGHQSGFSQSLAQDLQYVCMCCMCAKECVHMYTLVYMSVYKAVIDFLGGKHFYDKHHL